jgi:hypothetical protein
MLALLFPAPSDWLFSVSPRASGPSLRFSDRFAHGAGAYQEEAEWKTLN